MLKMIKRFLGFEDESSSSNQYKDDCATLSEARILLSEMRTNELRLHRKIDHLNTKLNRLQKVCRAYIEYFEREEGESE